MKKVAFISLLSVFLIMSCRDGKFIPDGSLVNNEKQTKENEVTTEVEDSFLIMADSMAVDPVVSNDVISRGDLGIFELRGPVKKCVFKYEGYSVTCFFSEEGIWLSENGQSLSSMYPGEIKRDKKGRLISACNEGDIFIGYEYDERGLVVKSYDGGESIKYYDADGYLKKSKETVYPDMGSEDAPEKYTMTYSILEKDSYGNWTKRKEVSDNGTVSYTTRVITYYN